MGTLRSPTACVFFLATIVTASAEPQLRQGEVAKRCSTIVDDEKRLKCFDDLFSAKRPERDVPGASAAKSNWSITGDTSAAGNSPQFSAGLVVGDVALILRCRQERTEAAFSTRDTYLGQETVTVRYRLDQQEPVKEVWRSSMNGRAAFAPKTEDFIRALPDKGRVFIRAIAADGNNKDANFQLAGVSEIKEKIARVCNWPNATDEPTTGTIKRLQSQ
jgi:hypothetical protein